MKYHLFSFSFLFYIYFQTYPWLTADVDVLTDIHSQTTTANTINNANIDSNSNSYVDIDGKGLNSTSYIDASGSVKVPSSAAMNLHVSFDHRTALPFPSSVDGNSFEISYENSRENVEQSVERFPEVDRAGQLSLSLSLRRAFRSLMHQAIADIIDPSG